MYKLKVSYGCVDEPEMATTDILGTYESLGEATEAAEDKFGDIIDGLSGNTDICFGEVASSLYDHYVTYGDHDVESGRVVWGYDYYYYVSVVER